MKLHRAFWCVILAGVALVVLGYVSFMETGPDKTSAGAPDANGVA
jgi:hypothetical protein